ncbi:MAG: NAD(P)/FAD-dependent oxidoreductase [Deltaproteobacteria bacterium]|nr:NAD(P)/FAD-dependent oxidoreductase [Deltaproteobacteria bacterium]
MGGDPLLILGGGPAGLAAAHELVARGHRPTVCEARSQVGGIARTETYKGFGFDIGGHRFFTKNERIDRLWRRRMGADFLKVARLSRIYYRGRFFQYPLSLPNTVANLGLRESALIALSYGAARVFPHPEEENFEQWVSNRFGQRLYETFFRTYTEKVWGIPCTRIQADWAAQRIQGLSLAAAVANALLGGRRAKSLIDEFDYPRLGPGMMWERFRDEIERGGGRVRCGCEAVRLTHDGRRVTGVGLRENGRDLDVRADQIISSVPLHRLVRLLEPAAPEPVLRAASHLTYRSFLMVGLLVDRPALFPDQWIYVHSPDVKVGRIQNFKNWSAALAPDPARTNVGMEYFCDEGDELWCLPDSALGALAARELGALGLAEAADVCDSFVVRQPDAYPIYDQGYKEHLTVIREYLAGFENVQTVGRAGMHRYNNMDHSMLTGILGAENAVGAQHDLWAVNDEEEYLEEGQRGRATPAAEVLVATTLARLDKLALATAVGTVSGLALFCATLWLVIKGGAVVGPNLGLLSQYFAGYTVSVEGSFVAFGYSFLWGFLFGWLLAYTRNLAVAFYVHHVKRRGASVSLATLLDRV